MQGNINGVFKQAKKYEEMDKKLIPFARILEELANSFQIKKLQEFVNSFMEDMDLKK